MNFNKIVRNLNTIIVRKSNLIHFGNHFTKNLCTSRNVMPSTSNEEFMNLLPSIIDQLTHSLDIPDVIKKHFERSLQYNVPCRKLNKEHVVTFTYRHLENTEYVTANNIQLANILGWCFEILLSVIAVADDIWDTSQNRNNKPCWYKVKNVGIKQAWNDSKMMESAMYLFLKKHFVNHKSYINLLKLFSEVNAITTVGQRMDLYFSQNCRNDYIEFFKIKNYMEMVKHKTSYLVSLLPVVSGIYLTNKHNFLLSKDVEDILFILGYLIQVKDDAEDYCVDATSSCNRGNDIPEGKLTWFITKALELATPQQLEVLINNYGKPELECQKLIENTYEEMQLCSLYHRHRNDIIQKVKQRLHSVPDTQTKRFFDAYLDTYFNKQ